MTSRRTASPCPALPLRASTRPRAAALALAPAVTLAAALALQGCTSLAPEYQRPSAPVPARFDAPADPVPAGAMPDWQALVRDAEVRALVETALANNRDLRIAALNVERARAAGTAADANRLPTLGALALAQRAPSTTNGRQTNLFEAGLTVNAYELDLFGRLADASQAARANLLASEHAQRATRLALVCQVVAAALGVQADADLVALAATQLEGRAETLRLTELRARAGAASELDLDTARTLDAQSRIALAQARRQQAQDRDALALLLGQPVPATFAAAPTSAGVSLDALAPVPVQLDSAVLLARPDVMQAEQSLRAANANIGSARAAMFPKLTLTGQGGEVSSTLAGLGSGKLAWSLLVQSTVSLIDWGRNEAGVTTARADRDVAVAQYDKTVQAAFRDVADALAGLATWRAQREAAQAQRDAEAGRARLTRLRHEQGAASLLELLDAERSSAAAESALVQARLGEALNRLALYRAFGGAEAAGPQR